MLMFAFKGGAVTSISARQCFQSKRQLFLRKGTSSNRITWGIVQGSSSSCQYFAIPDYSTLLLTPHSLSGDETKIGYEHKVSAISFDGDSDESLSFYSSESNRNLSCSDGGLLELSNISIDSVFRGAIGAVRKFGFLSKNEVKAEVKTSDENNSDVVDDEYEHYKLFQISSITDPPRNIISVSLDPSGTILAATDAFGRVIIIDLSSKQIIRIFKGFREAEIFWIQRSRSGSIPIVYITIYAKQRQVVEIFRMRHGGRVNSIQMNSGDQIFQCYSPSSHASCLIFRGGSMLSEINIIDSPNTRNDVVNNASTSGLNVRMLRQLLSSDNNFDISPEKVLDAFKNMPSLTEMKEALDLLASSLSLDKVFQGVQRSDFHAKLLSIAEERIVNVVDEKGSARNLAQMDEMKVKIQHHRQVRVYNV